jgi:hypothetical protein
MAILNRTKTTDLVRLGQDYRGSRAGEIVKVVGDPPPGLTTFEPWNGAAPKNVRTFDHARDLRAAEYLTAVQREASAPAPAPMTPEDIKRECGIDVEDARRYGLAPASGHAFVNEGFINRTVSRVSTWTRADVESWRDGFMELARKIK